jgi:hypothetical protein
MGGRTNVHDEEQSGWPSVVSDELIQSERRYFTTSELLCEFHALFSTRLSQLGWVITSFAQDGF